MTTFLLVRHGQSEANRRRIFAGNLDSPLEPLGYRQAEQTAAYIAAHDAVDAVYASDLRRAFDTGRCIAARLGLEAIPDPALREIHAGEWEGVSFDVLVERDAAAYDVWLHDIGHAQCTGGESVAQLGERIREALRRIAEENDGRVIVIATHATPIRVMQCLVQEGDLARMKDIPWVSNASVSRLVYDRGTWCFTSVSEDAHLGEMRTVLGKNA